jgi:hypothetical protein
MQALRQGLGQVLHQEISHAVIHLTHRPQTSRFDL